jgi:UDPglucose--hexose-1-phosphate uridylyltransferase
MSWSTIREIRVNPIIPAESVLIATARADRPAESETQWQLDQRSMVPACPFCPGNEHQTPPPILQRPEHGPWSIRSVRNLYPVFGDERSLPELRLGMHRIIDGYGHHEVIIDHPNHGIQIAEMGRDHLELLFTVYQQRMVDLYRVPGKHRYVLVFKNFGPASGGSIAHTHSQIIAMPVIPANVDMELAASRSHLRATGNCIFCALIDEDLRYDATLFDRQTGEQRRSIAVSDYVIEANDSCVAIKPFASRYPWEIHVLPRRHDHDYRNSSPVEIGDLAQVVQRVMQRLAAVLGVVQYNFFLHSAPGHEGGHWARSFHWHLEICPRTAVPNGFELGSGLAINTLSPEQAAATLRAITLRPEP